MTDLILETIAVSTLTTVFVNWLYGVVEKALSRRSARHVTSSE